MSAKMANRQQLYKFKGHRGLQARADKKREDSKRQRDELVMDRRGVLQEIQESKTKSTDSKSGGKLTAKSGCRLEELKEWQKQRDLRRQEEKMKLKPTFNRFGGNGVPKSCDSHVTLKQPKSSKDIPVKVTEVPLVKDVHKPKMTTRSQNMTTTTNKTSMVTRKTTATTSKTSKATNRTSTTDSKANTTTSKISTTTSKANSTTSKSSITTRKINDTTTGKANTITSKTGSAGTNKSRSTVKSVNSIVDASLSLKPKITVAKTTRVSTLVAKKSTLQDGHKAISKPKKIYTTSKSHDDQVTSNIQEKTSKQSVTCDPNQHPAWIPGASLASSKSSVPNFDEAFSKPFFSPFKFTGSTTVTTAPSEQIKFTFRKEVTAETLSLPVVNEIANDSLENDEKEDPLPNLDEVTTDYPSDTEPLTGNKSDVSIENINISLAHNNNFTNQQREEEEDTYGIKMASLSLQSPPTLHEPPPRFSSLNSSSAQLSSSVASCNVTSSGETERSTENCQLIFRSYRQLHTDVVERFTSLCQEWEEKLDQFSQHEDAPTDEVIDDIRTTTCQARLLMKQKLKQYLELVEMAENNSGEKKTTPEDLQGFWDMVYFQVESIDKRFATARQLELNNWQPPMEEETVTKKPPRRSKRRASQAASAKIVTSDKSVPSERLQAARAKRDAARSRLREMKLAAAKMKETTRQEVEESKELDMSPSKVMKMNEPAGSGLTPPSRQNSALSQENVPVGNLLLLSPHTPPQQQQVFKTPKNKSTKTRHSSRSDSSQDEEVPVETILSFSLHTPPTQQFVFRTPKSKSSRKRHPSHSGSSTKKLVEPEGAFTTKLVQINASKKLLQELETDLIVSPARRSRRLVNRERDEVIVDSFLDLPEDTDFAYFPNKAI